MAPSWLRYLLIAIVIAKQTNQHEQPTAQRLPGSFVPLHQPYVPHSGGHSVILRFRGGKSQAMRIISVVSRNLGN